MTKFFKGKSKKAAQVPQAPRSMEEIQKEYGELRAHSGELQYTIYVYEADLARMNSRLRELNNEAAARQQLDKATETKPEVKDVINEQPTTN